MTISLPGLTSSTGRVVDRRPLGVEAQPQWVAAVVAARME
jgi:hypothetical protein